MMGNKKRLITIATMVIAVIGIVILFFVFTKNTANGSVLRSTLAEGNYYVQKEVAGIATTVSSAVENFASQNTSESKVDRDRRLAQYFTSDSPAYGYTLDNIGGDITKSVAKTTSVANMGCVSETGEITCARVLVQTKFYYGENYLTMGQSYWVNVSKQSGKYMAIDVGVMK